ncbi:MAG: insulinase family protein [Gemmatimonadetes bacterium]|nr:insulinase family protein [Gemmatimonadota bacterium]
MRYCRHGAVVLSLLALAAPAAAQEAPPIAYETFTLENGLRFIVHEDHSTPVVAVDVWYDVGSAHEPAGRTGFAHLFEHMLFQETKNLKKGEFDRLVRSAGGTLNGTTSEDRTAYFETLPSNRINLALWLEAERMAQLAVTQQNFEREREVVKEERRLRVENQPYGESFMVRDSVANDYQPYNHHPIGSMADLDAATPDDVHAFYKQFYVPNNATIVVAGDVDVPQVKELAGQYFGWIPRGLERAPLPEPPPVPRLDGERRVTVEDKLANTPLFQSAYTIPGHGHPDTYALQLLTSIFGEGESSRLHQRLVKDEKAALGIFSGSNSRIGPGLFYLIALPNQGVPIERIEALINDEVEKLIREGVPERELRKAKNQLRAGMVMDRLRVQSKAEALHHYRLLHGDVAQVNTDLDRYTAVTPAQIVEAARKYLAPANRTVVIVLPAQKAAAAGATPMPAGK